MKRIGKLVAIVEVVLLLTVLPAVASHTASLEYPAVPPAGSVTVRAIIAEPELNSLVASVVLGPGGAVDAEETAVNLCESALVAWEGPSCEVLGADPTPTFCALPAAGCCAAAVAAEGVPTTITCTGRTRTGDKGIRIKRGHSGVSAAKIVVEPFPPFGPAETNLQALNYDHSSGASITEDLLSRYCLRVDRGNPAVDGNVNFTVRYFRPDLGPPGGPQVVSFTVNTSGKNDTELHQAIVDGFTNLGLGLELGVMDEPGMKCVFDDTFNGPLVSIWNLFERGVREVGIDGLPGQRIVAETNSDPQQGEIPTLSEWGLILLVALLSVSALWMLRRRREASSPI